MGLGLPLEPGTYYVGVTNANGTSAPMSYTLLSRGIGAGQSLPVTTVDFAGGTAAQTDLAPREVAYYKVTVPAGQTSWQVKLSATTGDVALAVNQGYVPSVGSRGNTVLRMGWGCRTRACGWRSPGTSTTCCCRRMRRTMARRRRRFRRATTIWR